MNCVLANGIRKLLANRSLVRLPRVSRAHQLAEISNGVVFFKHHRKDGTRTHELSQFTKERARRMNMVETLSLRLRNAEALDRSNLESSLLNGSEDGGSMTLADGVRLDDAECTL